MQYANSSRLNRKQVVVRTYPQGFINPTDSLQNFLSQGYRVIMCQQFLCKDGTQGNEYILEKEIEE